MKKSHYSLNKNQIETAYQQIKSSLSNQRWWKNEKNRDKAIKQFNKLELESFYEKIKLDSQKHLDNFLNRVQKWCSNCLDKKHWKKLKKEVEASINQQKLDLGKNIKIELDQKAYRLLLQSSEQSGRNFSDLIIEHFTEVELDTIETERPTSDFSSIDNSELVAQKLNQYEVVNKKNINTIEIWRLAGSQCQSISKATQKRCKKISPDLEIKKQMIDGICYEYAVCSTHNSPNAQLDEMYLME